MIKFISFLLAAILIILGIPGFVTWDKNLSDFKFLLTHLSSEPELETYTTDMNAYLRTYYEIKNHQPYYYSLGQSVVGDASRDNLPGEIWGWKLPLIFYLWAIIPGPAGISIYLAFVFLVILTLVASYKLASRFSLSWAWLSPWLLAPYFLTPLTQLTLLQVEWWALCFLILGLTLLVYEKKFLAMIFLALAIFTRELFLFHVVMIFLVYLLFRRYRDFWIFLFPVITLVFFYIFVHLPNVYLFETFGSVTSWWRTGFSRGWFLVRPTLSFSSWNYLFFSFHPLRIALFLSLAGLVGRFFLSRQKLISALAMASFVPFFLFIFFFGIQTKWQDYWGIYYLPLALIFTPVILSVIDSVKS